MTSVFIIVFVLLTITTGLQASIHRENVTFHLFTNPEETIELNYENTNQHLVDKNAEIIFLIHGWTQNRNHHSYTLLKNAYFSRRDKTFYVIAMDYAEAAGQPYFKAIHDAPKVGQSLGDFIIHMEYSGASSLDKIHVVAHSLGAHVAGYAGKHIQEKLSRKIRRITGLDPAGPFFQGVVVTNKNRLSKNDAEIVFVVHTDRTMFGVRSSCGTIDVYPNGGANQPGCPDYYRGEIFFCSHHKSYEQFADAVENPGTLWATQCTNYAAYDDGECRNNRKIDMGGDFTRNDDGDYFLHTNDNKPFAKNYY